MITSEEQMAKERLDKYFSVTVRNTDNLSLSGRYPVNLRVDTSMVEDYLNSKIDTNPAADVRRDWSVYFGLEGDKLGDFSLTSEQKEILPQIGGVTVPEHALIFINVSALWESLKVRMLPSNNESLRQVVCENLAHELEHVVIYSNPAQRAELVKNTRFSQNLGRSAKLVTHLLAFPAAAKAIRDDAVREPGGKMSRRYFLFLSTSAVASVVTHFVAPFIGGITSGVYNEHFDSVHKPAYEASKEWKKLAGAIQVVEA